MILIDTSAWIEFDRATGSAIDTRLTALIEDRGPICGTEPVMMELLSGVRSDQDAARLRRLLRSHAWLPVRRDDFEAAAAIYRTCRRAGNEPGQSAVDCLIAAVAMRNNSAVLAADGDFDKIAQVMPLQLAG